MTALRLAVMSVLLLPAAFQAQQTPVRDRAAFTSSGTALIRGTVVIDDETRTPLRRARVGLSRIGAEDIRWASTDEQGQFVFGDLPAATYSLSAGKGGFIGMSAGAVKPGMPGRQVVLRDGDAVVAPPIALPRGAVIAGRLLDSAGQPVRNAQVRASRFVIVNGERQLRTGTATWTAVTNDHGDYRIFDLPAGDYVVSAWQNAVLTLSDTTQADLDAARKPAAAGAVATPSTTTGPAAIGRPFVHAPTLYPGTVQEASATPIVLKAGDERLGVDFALQRVPVARVSGTVLGIDGKPIAGLTVTSSLRHSPVFTRVSGSGAQTGADGSFAAVGLAPGEYIFHVRGAAGLAAQRAEQLVAAGLGNQSTLNAAGQWASADVSVNGADISGITLQLQPGMEVSGRFVTRANVPVDLSRVRVYITPVGAAPLERGFNGNVTAPGAFRIEGVIPGSYTLSISALPVAYTAKSAMLGDRDLLDVPFDVNPGANVSDIVVTLSDVRTELSGVLTSALGQPASHLYVLAFSQDRAHWTRNSRRVLTARAGENGSYVLAGLPAGDYYLCALTEIDTTLQYEAEYLDQLVPASIRISLADGEKKVQNLRTGG